VSISSALSSKLRLRLRGRIRDKASLQLRRNEAWRMQNEKEGRTAAHGYRVYRTGGMEGYSHNPKRSYDWFTPNRDYCLRDKLRNK
jgi:hypothetical protein